MPYTPEEDLKPSDKGYWARGVEDIARTLPGERLLTRDRLLVISTVEAFRTLVRKVMSADFESGRKGREPGDLFITQFRGAPLVNVTARTDKTEPEVVWLREMSEHGKKVTGAALVRSIAEFEGHNGLKGSDLLNFCMSELDGKNVQDPKSPIRIVENLDHHVSDRKISFNRTAGNATNSEGVASLSDIGNGIASIEQAKLIINMEAQRLGVTAEAMLDPATVSRMAKKSPLLAKVLKFFSS